MSISTHTRSAPLRGLVIGWALAVLLTQALASTPGNLAGPRPALTALFVVLLVAASVSEELPTGPTPRRHPWSLILAVSFLASPLVAMVVAGSASFAAALARGRSTLDTLVASATLVIALSLGTMAGNQVAPLVEPTRNGVISSMWLVGVGVASITAYLTALVVGSAIEASVRGLAFPATVSRSVRASGAIDSLLVFMAPLFIVVGLSAPLLTPLLVVVVLAVRHSAMTADSERHAATHDQVTGMANRAQFLDHADLLLDAARRENAKVALITVALEGVTGIADRLGLDLRDEVLRQVAGRIDDEARTVDLVARLDGETFAFLLGRIESDDDATIVAHRLVDSIERRIEVRGVPIGIDAHAGVAVFPYNGTTVCDLTNGAEMAAHTAKATSNPVSTASTLEVGLGTATDRHTLLADLQRALDNEELTVFYQPKMHTRTDDITSVEALIRWNHPTEGLVEPDRFMPQAEHTDLINEITDRVLELALEQLAAWHARGLIIGVAVNASARNLHDLHFPDRVRSALLFHGIDPTFLEIEITENAVLQDPTRSASVLGHLRGLGVTLAIDDFGTGYSSLASLRRLTIDRIKIDRSFVTELATNGGDLNIVRSIIDLGRNLGLSTIAEGVETREVLDIVRALGCDEYQGFLVSAPLCASAVTELMENRRAARVPLRIVR